MESQSKARRAQKRKRGSKSTKKTPKNVSLLLAQHTSTTCKQSALVIQSEKKRIKRTGQKNDEEAKQKVDTRGIQIREYCDKMGLSNDEWITECSRVTHRFRNYLHSTRLTGVLIPYVECLPTVHFKVHFKDSTYFLQVGCTGDGFSVCSLWEDHGIVSKKFGYASSDLPQFEGLYGLRDEILRLRECLFPGQNRIPEMLDGTIKLGGTFS